MKNAGWPYSESPFHEGELALQKKAGVQEKIDVQGRRMIRPYLIEQHRQFFAQLPYVLIGSLDESGAPWTSLLTGVPGFLSTPDEHTLRVVTHPLPGDPLSIAVGDDIGVLGIELATRRRNRINGKVSQLTGDGFIIRVQQSFGNCPQYIQSRDVVGSRAISSVRSVDPIKSFSASDKKIITLADTFFITTAYQNKAGRNNSGVDVSHRGGQPGFVSIEGDHQLLIPDYSGNNHFNTFGNILLNPRAGLLFIDFENGDLLYLTGTAEVLWNSFKYSDGKTTRRALSFQLAKGYRVAAAITLCWSAPELSPFLAGNE